MKLHAAAAGVAAILLACVSPLRATTITSYSVSSWASSTTGSLHDADFTHIQFTTYGPAGYTSSDGFNITGPDGPGNFSLQGLSYQSNPSLEGGNDSNATVKVTAPGSGETALLFLIGSNPSASGYTVTLSDGEIFNLAGSTTFFGVSVSHPITFATLQATSGSNLILQDVSYGTSTLPNDGSGGSSGGGGGTSAVPEATTILLFGAGLVMVAVAKKRVSVV